MTNNILGAKDFKGKKRKLLYFKYVFDVGFNRASYLKYLVAFFGLASKNIRDTMILAFIYAIFCFALGYFWLRWKLADIENEITNSYNPLFRKLNRISVAKNFKRNI